jgi:hypothetical protein
MRRFTFDEMTATHSFFIISQAFASSVGLFDRKRLETTMGIS